MSFASVMAGKSPSAWWRQGEASGTTMVDSSGNNRNGTYPNPPTFGAPALIHDGDTDTANTYSKTTTTYGAIPDAPWLNATAFSLFVRIKPATVTGTQVIAARFATSINDAWSLRLDDANLRLYVNRAAGDYPSVSLGTLVAGDEHSVGFSYNAGVARAFLDGVFVGSLTSTVKVVNAALSVGRSGYGEPFGGVLDELAFWSGTALTDADHADLHSAAGGPAASRVVTLSATALGASGSFALDSQSPSVATQITLSATARTPSASFSLDGPTLTPEIVLEGAANSARGSFDLQLPAIAEAATDAVDRSNGRTRVCEWTVEVEPPVTSAPRDRGLDESQAYSISGTTLVDGRPT